MKWKKGQFIKTQDKRYSHIKYAGIITEVFSDMIQIFGAGYEELGYHELNIKEYRIYSVGGDEVCFVIEQGMKELESKRLKAEIKFRQLDQEYTEMTEVKSQLIK